MDMNYTSHSAWSQVDAHQHALKYLPDDLTSLADSLENFMVHHAAAEGMGITVPEYAETDKNLRSVEKLLSTLLARDDRPLTEKRELPNYLYCTCHDFSLIAAATLRSRAVPARLRVGFVNYLTNNFWEDHWLCEYYQDDKWQLFDPQMGKQARTNFNINFPIDKLDRRRFKSAAEMWQDLANGKTSSRHCGVSFIGLSGEWFCACNLLRDAVALLKIETLPWDFWGMSVSINEQKRVNSEQREQLGFLAESILEIEDENTLAQDSIINLAWALPHNNHVLSLSGDKLSSCAIY